MVDYISLVRARLLDPTGPVFPLLGGARVWPVDLPEKNPATGQGFSLADGPGIAISLEGGSAHQEIPIQAARIKVTVCADVNQYVVANRVYRAVHDWLHGINRVDLGEAGFILASQAASLGTDFTDPDVAWATNVSFFSVTAHEGPAPAPAPILFSLLHGLDETPVAVTTLTFSGALLTLQNPGWDGTNLYLSAAGPGLIALVYVFPDPSPSSGDFLVPFGLVTAPTLADPVPVIDGWDGTNLDFPPSPPNITSVVFVFV